MTVEQQRAQEWARFLTQRVPGKVSEAPPKTSLLIVEGRSFLRHFVHASQATSPTFSTRMFARDYVEAIPTAARTIVTMDVPSLLTHPRWPVDMTGVTSALEWVREINHIDRYLIDNDIAPVTSNSRHLLYDLAPFEWQLRCLVTEAFISGKRAVTIVGCVMRDDPKTTGVCVEPGKPLYCSQGEPQTLDALSMAIRCVTCHEIVVLESHDPEALAALLCMIRGTSRQERTSCQIYLHWFSFHWFNVTELYIHLHDIKAQGITYPGVAWLGVLLASTSPTVALPEHEGDTAITLDTLELYTTTEGKRACIVHSINTMETCTLSKSVELFNKTPVPYNELKETQWLVFFMHLAQRCFVARLGSDHPPPWPVQQGALELVLPMSYFHALFGSLGDYAVRVQGLKVPSTMTAHWARVKRLGWAMDHWTSLRATTSTRVEWPSTVATETEAWTTGVVYRRGVLVKMTMT